MIKIDLGIIEVHNESFKIYDISKYLNIINPVIEKKIIINKCDYKNTFYCKNILIKSGFNDNFYDEKGISITATEILFEFLYNDFTHCKINNEFVKKYPFILNTPVLIKPGIFRKHEKYLLPLFITDYYTEPFIYGENKFERYGRFNYIISNLDKIIDKIIIDK